METISSYQQQAIDFLNATGTKFSAKFKHTGYYFPDDKDTRNIYTIRLQRGKKSYSFTFGQSMASSEIGEEPTAYDVLACLTKYDPGTFENFCSDYGYDTYSRKAEKTYKAVCKEYQNVCRLFSESELEQLAEIS